MNSLRYNLQYLADNQRLIMESLQHPPSTTVNHEPHQQQQHHIDDMDHRQVEEPHSIINNYYPAIPNYGAPPTLLPSLPFGNDEKRYVRI